MRLSLHVSDAMHDLLRERVDLAVRYGQLADSTLVARPLATTERVLVASPDYLARHGAPQQPSELAQHNCLSLYLGGRPQLQWRFERDGQATTVRVQGNRRADDGALVRQWALQGVGIAYKAKFDVWADLRAGRLVRLLPGWGGERFPLHAIVPAQRHMPLRVRRVLDELVLRFAELEHDTVASPPAD